MLAGAIARNVFEDLHIKHIPDAAMKELNQAIRNAVFTALQALRATPRLSRARKYVNYHLHFIPKYWEPPQLLSGYVDSIDPKNQWLDALMRGELAPSVWSAEEFDGSSPEELADAWIAALAKRFPKAPSDAVALERPRYLEVANLAKAWRERNPQAGLATLADSVQQIYDRLAAPHGRDARGQPIWPEQRSVPSSND